ncbi:MAG: hypothetical protein JNJ61_13460 [Anaerolineae bacterium]|nr:hypothetical protein [Anaerolineae bacterium]
MSRMVPFISVETFDPTASPQAHFAQLMQAHGFDENDLAANRSGHITERQAEAMKGLARSKVRFLLLFILIAIALPLLSQFTMAIPRESIIFTAIVVPILGIWLIVELFRKASPGRGQVLSVEGYFEIDADATFSTGGVSYHYLRQIIGTGMIRRYQRVALLRRARFQGNYILSNVQYRVYYYQNRSVSYFLSMELI